jgi:hypothetical protein
MDLSHLHRLFLEAKRLIRHSEYVVVGSLSVLGVAERPADIPGRMLMSIDVDCYARADPGRIFELKEALGEGSPFDAKHGYFLDPISPDLPTLPEHWEHRLIPVALEGGIVVYFLDPNDAAVSKYARCDVRDREWIRAGLKGALLSAPVIESRLRTTHFLDAAERDRAFKALGEDRKFSKKPAS